jgi:formylglycine-generating enzyme required for sulfatase activity
MKYRIITLSLLLLTAFAFAATAPVVSNVVMLQRSDGSELVDVTFDLADAENDTCAISILISADEGNTFTIIPTPANLSGAIGAGIVPGTGKIVVWDIGAESYDIQGNQYRVKVTADDGTSDVPANFVFVEGGTFTMGNTLGGGSSVELPTHSVTLSAFYMGIYEVTQSEWQATMDSIPAYDCGVGDNYPAYYVSWYDLIKYCNLRSMEEGLTPVYTISGSTDPANWGTVPVSENATWDAVICNWSANGFRLPTEAEWEYAARGGTTNPDYIYSGSNDINAVAWYEGNNTTDGSKPVGGKAANGLGIYDMSGNVNEWCWDWWGFYSSAAQNNPTGSGSGSYRMLRGGSWSCYAYDCRVSVRRSLLPYERYNFAGLRLVRADF